MSTVADPATASTRRASGDHRRVALWACLGAGFATLFDATTVAYTAPALSQTLDAPTAAVQWFLASFSLTFGLGLVPAGRLGDAFGRRRLFVLGLAVFLVGGILSAGGPDVTAVIAGRLVQGLGAGFVSAQVLGVMQDLFRGAARVRAFVAYTAAGAAAGLVGPIVAGLLLTLVPEAAAWRAILAAPLPLTIAAIVLAWRGLPRESARAARVTLDLPGIALLGALVVLLMLPVIEPGLGASFQVGIAATCAAIAISLVVWERSYIRRGRLALFTPVLMRSRGFVAGNVVALLWFGALLGQGAVLTLYLLQTTGAPPIAIAAVFLPGAIGRLLVSLVSRRLFERFGTGVLVAGLAIETVLAASLAVTVTALDAGALLVVLAVVNGGLGVAGGLVEPPLRTLTLAHATASLHGVAASFLQLTQRLSATYVVALATGIVLGSSGLATATSLQQALVVCAVAMALAAIVSLDPSLRRAASGLRAVAAARGQGSAPGDTGRMPETLASWTIELVPWHDDRAAALRAAMDAEVGPRYASRLEEISAEQAERHSRALAIDPETIVATILAVDAEGRPVGHAALRDLGPDFAGSLEVKRVFVEPGSRGTGVSRRLMAELETIALREGAERLILQTGDRQPDAVALYEHIGYTRIPTYPPYLEITFSNCFEKHLAA